MRKRTRKTHFEDAVEILVRVTGSVASAREVERLVKEGTVLFNVRENHEPHYAFLRVRTNTEIVFSSRSRKVLRFLIDANFSEARQQFLEWRDAWEREAPEYIQRAFRLEYLAMDRMIFLASE